MKVIRTIKEMRKIILQHKKKTIGFVPTMGYLHEGHLSLVDAAHKENDLVILSIFVNPLQFGPNEDFDRYPRDEERDLELAKKHYVDYVFYPHVNEMYPEELSLKMTMTKRVNVLCGASRPGHFDGVITVVTKLFHIIEPNRAYFGLKDAQQVAVMDALTENLNFPIEIVGLPTVRQTNGLALSSRNKYLSENEMENALSLYNSLKLGKKLIEQGTKKKSVIVEEVRNYLKLNCNGKIDYVNLYTYPKLEDVEIIEQQVVLAVAINYEKARLIDNLILDQNGNQLNRVVIGGN